MGSIVNRLTSGKVGTRMTALLIIGTGLADLWHFHVIGTNADLVMISGAASALGVHVAHTSTTTVNNSVTPGG